MIAGENLKVNSLQSLLEKLRGSLRASLKIDFEDFSKLAEFFLH